MTSPLIRTSPYLTMVTEVREVLRLPPMGEFSAASRTTDELVTEGFEEVPAPLVLTVDVDTQGWAR